MSSKWPPSRRSTRCVKPAAFDADSPQLGERLVDDLAWAQREIARREGGGARERHGDDRPVLAAAHVHDVAVWLAERELLDALADAAVAVVTLRVRERHDARVRPRVDGVAGREGGALDAEQAAEEHAAGLGVDAAIGRFSHVPLGA